MNNLIILISTFKVFLREWNEIENDGELLEMLRSSEEELLTTDYIGLTVLSPSFS